jgi:hypothetical protein
MQHYNVPMDNRESSYISQYKLNIYAALRCTRHVRHTKVFRIQSELVTNYCFVF